jgi:hypothetical protein
MDQDVSNAKKAKAREANKAATLREHYLEQLDFVPGLKKLVGNATLVNGEVKSCSDYSYKADQYAGDGFRIIGDASGRWTGEHLFVLSTDAFFSLHRSTLLVGGPSSTF